MTDVVTPAVRVLIVDPDRRVRSALASLIDLAPELVLIGATDRIDEALGLIDSEDPDLVVLDPRLPDVDGGLELITTIRERRRGIGIVVLTWDDAVGSRSLTAGADRYVPRTIEPQDLMATIGSVLGTRGQADPAPSA